MNNKVNFFKPEDFNDLYGGTTDIRLFLAKMANAKLEREGIIVYSKHTEPVTIGSMLKDNFPQESYWSSPGQEKSTHKALLICIEEIKKCEHPNEKIKKYTSQTEKDGPLPTGLQLYPTELEFKCECGAKVEPLTFGVVE